MRPSRATPNRRFEPPEFHAVGPPEDWHPMPGVAAGAWYVPRALGQNGNTARRRRIRMVAAGTATGVSIAVLTACGGSGERQDQDEPRGEFPVEVTTAKFPTRQRLAQPTRLRLGVRNVGDEALPELAVTVCLEDCVADGSFAIRLDDPALANPNRPVWILENKYPRVVGEPPPKGSSPGTVAQTNTFGFGALEPDETREIVWKVTPVRGGTYTLNYDVEAGLQGKARAVTADGSRPTGKFVVTISTRPQQSRVDGQGRVVPGRAQPSP